MPTDSSVMKTLMNNLEKPVKLKPEPPYPDHSTLPSSCVVWDSTITNHRVLRSYQYDDEVCCWIDILTNDRLSVDFVSRYCTPTKRALSQSTLDLVDTTL